MLRAAAGGRWVDERQVVQRWWMEPMGWMDRSAGGASEEGAAGGASEGGAAGAAGAVG